MNLNEYLKNTCTQVKNPRLLEMDGMKKIFLILTSYILEVDVCKHINLYEVYSSEVYPRYIRLDKKDYIIWDNHFWDLYGHFLLICFLYDDLQILMPKDHCIECFKSLMLLFLSSRFEKIPSLSRYIAEEYKNLNTKVFRYDKAENINIILAENGYLEQLNLARIFGYCHEIAHVAFRKQNQLSFTVKNKIIDYCEQWMSLYKLNKHIDLISEDKNSDSNLEITYSISKQLLEDEDGRMLEEICCDVIAMYTMVTYFEIQGLSKDEIGNKIAIVDYFLLFTWWLSSNEQYWNMMRMIYLDPVSNDNAFVDEKNPFYNYANKITEELLVRVNFTFNFFAEFSGIPIQNKRVISKLINEGFCDMLEQANGYDVMQKILTKYGVSHKDFNSGLKHLQKKNRLIRWIIE